MQLLSEDFYKVNYLRQ